MIDRARLEVDAYLKKELGRLLPAAGWLSEETAGGGTERSPTRFLS